MLVKIHEEIMVLHKINYKYENELFQILYIAYKIISFKEHRKSNRYYFLESILNKKFKIKEYILYFRLLHKMFTFRTLEQ